MSGVSSVCASWSIKVILSLFRSFLLLPLEESLSFDKITPMTLKRKVLFLVIITMMTLPTFV